MERTVGNAYFTEQLVARIRRETSAATLRSVVRFGTIVATGEGKKSIPMRMASIANIRQIPSAWAVLEGEVQDVADRRSGRCAECNVSYS